jgi:hypothetical protein
MTTSRILAMIDSPEGLPRLPRNARTDSFYSLAPRLSKVIEFTEFIEFVEWRRVEINRDKTSSLSYWVIEFIELKETGDTMETQ